MARRLHVGRPRPRDNIRVPDDRHTNGPGTGTDLPRRRRGGRVARRATGAGRSTGADGPALRPP